MRELIDKLEKNQKLSTEEWIGLIEEDYDTEYLFAKADKIRRQQYGEDVYIRGLIEISSYCKNNCFYCGIRRDNARAQRYRLDYEQIMECVDTGYKLGFRTFVLQGGEDMFFTSERVEKIVFDIKKRYKDVTKM